MFSFAVYSRTHRIDRLQMNSWYIYYVFWNFLVSLSGPSGLHIEATPKPNTDQRGLNLFSFDPLKVTGATAQSHQGHQVIWIACQVYLHFRHTEFEGALSCFDLKCRVILSSACMRTWMLILLPTSLMLAPHLQPFETSLVCLEPAFLPMHIFNRRLVSILCKDND